MKNILLGIFLLQSLLAHAQIQHNFEMDPQKTDCHNLPDLALLSTDSAMHMIESAAFRFEQNIKISKYRTPREAHFYTCDGEKGVVVVIENDSIFQIYSDMPKAIWDKFISTKDPIGYYQSAEFSQYRLKDD